MEIELRAWDEELKKMDYFNLELLQNSKDTTKLSPIECYQEVMLFTGLYDDTKWESLSKDEQQNFMIEKTFVDEITGEENWKGKKIYERDIVEVLNKGIFVISLKKGIFGFKYKKYGHFPLSEFRYFKVIGNKFENPKLLKEEDEE